MEVGNILLYFSPLISRHISFVSLRSLHAGGQIRDVEPTSGYCWPGVYDAEPTLAKYWVTMSCLTPRWMWARVTDGGPTLTRLWFKASWPYRQYTGTFCMYVAYEHPGRHETFVQCWYSVGPYTAALDRRCTGVGRTYILFCCDDDGGFCSVDTTQWPSVDLVPGQRRRRWTGIESALGLCLSFAGWSDDEKIYVLNFHIIVIIILFLFLHYFFLFQFLLTN